jgi:hypothetical protein
MKIFSEKLTADFDKSGAISAFGNHLDMRPGLMLFLLMTAYLTSQKSTGHRY